MAIGVVIDDQTVPKGVGQTNPMPVGTEYTTAIEYNADNNPIYIGEALPGTAKNATEWRIRKIIYDANQNPIDIQWANSSKKFEFIWDNRANYTYD